MVVEKKKGCLDDPVSMSTDTSFVTGHRSSSIQTPYKKNVKGGLLDDS